MDWVFLAGRIVFAVMFFNSGLVGHIIGRKGTAAYARQNRVPLPELSVVASGSMILVGSVLVALGAWGDLGALLIAASIYLSYRFAERIGRTLGDSAMNVVIRLSSFILICIGVQILWNGLSALLGAVIR